MRIVSITDLLTFSKSTDIRVLVTQWNCNSRKLFFVFFYVYFEWGIRICYQFSANHVQYITNCKSTFLKFITLLIGLFHNNKHCHSLLLSSCAVDQFSNCYVSFQRPSLFRRLVGALRSGNSNSDDEEGEIDTPSDYLTTTRRRSKTLTALPTMWVMLLFNWRLRRFEMLNFFHPEVKETFLCFWCLLYVFSS